jgi:WD40 repeat protein
MSVTDTSSSLTQNVTKIEAGAYVAAAAFLGRTPVLALGDGQIVFAEIGAEKRIEAHPDAGILCAARGPRTLVTGGDDGRVVEIAANGAVTEIAKEKTGWIDALAFREDGAIGWACGKTVRARSAKGELKSVAAPSTVRGLAFLSKGYRLAMAHYNGASLWFPNTDAGLDLYEWKGSHLDVTLSPGGRFLVTSMQENALHGWRLSDKQNMRMSGYPAKTRSLSWSSDGDWLATSGADACIVWPFKEKTGPMNKAPHECGVREARVSQVAFHPKALVIAVGYDDGWVLLCRLTDAAELLVHRPGETPEGAITALTWDGDGRHLLFGSAEGFAGLLTMPA